MYAKPLIIAGVTLVWIALLGWVVYEFLGGKI